MLGAIGRMLARPSVQRTVLICTVFVTVLSAGAYVTSERFGWFQWLMKGNSSVANIPQPEMPTGVSNLGEDDPVRNFAKTGVGHVLFTAPSTDNCRRTLFDNRTGASYEASDVMCGQPAEQQNERLQSMARPFKR